MSSGDECGAGRSSLKPAFLCSIERVLKPDGSILAHSSSQYVHPFFLYKTDLAAPWRKSSSACAMKGQTQILDQNISRFAALSASLEMYSSISQPHQRLKNAALSSIADNVEHF